jgi:hypothetical protein
MVFLFWHFEFFNVVRFQALSARFLWSLQCTEFRGGTEGLMKKIVGQLKEFSLRLWQNAKVRDRALSALVILVVLQIYFVRELLAAELLFGLLFAALLLLGGVCYAVGVVGEYGLDWAEVGVRVLGKCARRGYTGLEEISKKSFRHPRSESAR